MKLNVIATLTSLTLLASGLQAADKITLKDQKDKLSYSIGMNIGSSLKRQTVEVNLEALTQGIKDSLSGGKALMTEEEVQNTMMELQKQMMAKMEAQNKMEGEDNKKKGEVFLAANKKKEGVKTLPSGLQYKVIKDGTGKIPKATDMVTTHYRGTLIDGTEFDSSYKRNEPASFPVNGVIKGWTEALQLMKEGAKWQLFIPAELAYGERGAPGSPIGPNSTLVFDIELISVQSK